jgi:hypothetical protein
MMGPMRRRWLIIIAIVAVGTGAFLLRPRGVKAVVRNVGTNAMQDVRVIVTGRSYSVDDIQPGESRMVRVQPTGESSITLRYRDSNSGANSVHVDCYIEPGYSGSISVDVANGAVIRKTDAYW